MAVLLVHWAPAGVPLVAPAVSPVVRARRVDTGALVVTDAPFSELGGGSFRYDFTTDPSLEYSIRADGDPLGTGQVPAADRYQYGEVSGIAESLETSIPGDVLSALLEPYETINGSVAQALAMDINRIRVNLVTQQLELWNSAGTAILRTWPLSTTGGEPVVTVVGVQTERGVPT